MLSSLCRFHVAGYFIKMHISGRVRHSGLFAQLLIDVLLQPDHVELETSCLNALRSMLWTQEAGEAE